ncbi:MAG: hypothetical protein EOO29_07950 [Comamonadaceae bacterium]|nr:MAG: hypothetical protein EOO29_07950 [Comamonadaceae bacterium]
MFATPAVHAQSQSAPLPPPNFNAQDPCRAEISKFEQAIGYVRQGQGAQAATAMKEKWLPAKIESELLMSKGYCGIAKHLQDQRWNR